MAPMGAPDGLQMAQEAPGWQQEPPTLPQGDSRSSRDGPKILQDGPKGPQDGPKMASEGSNMVQRWHQEPPNKFQMRNKMTSQNKIVHLQKTTCSLCFFNENDLRGGTRRYQF